MNGLLDFVQGASNAAAGAIAGPVDLINMGLLGVGLPMPQSPFGGSQWMRERGLMRDPQNRTAGLLGESVGGVLPIIAAARAPQIAAGLLQAGDNLRAPTPMNVATRGQGGALYFRRTRGGPDNGTGHMMFARDHDSVRHYGPNLHTFNDASAATQGRIVDAADPAFQRKVAKALRLDPGIAAEYGRGAAAKLAKETNPTDIVNSAGLWDNLDLTQKVWDKILEPAGIHAVRTADGAIVFNPELVRMRATYPRGR
jgi:hypothetical protein